MSWPKVVCVWVIEVAVALSLFCDGRDAVMCCYRALASFGFQAVVIAGNVAPALVEWVGILHMLEDLHHHKQ